MKIIKLTFLLVLCTSVHSISAQRHYAGISALEMNYGMNLFGHCRSNANLSFSKYKNRTTYWKFGLNYFEKTFDFERETTSVVMLDETSENIPQITVFNKIARDYYMDAVYAKTVASNLTSLYLNLGLGAFTGVEVYKEEKNKYEFLIGPKIEAELEYFVSRRFGFLGKVTQYWNPFSKDVWNTTWNVGIKILLY